MFYDTGTELVGAFSDGFVEVVIANNGIAGKRVLWRRDGLCLRKAIEILVKVVGLFHVVGQGAFYCFRGGSLCGECAES